MKSFKATIDKIGINPFVFVPGSVLKTIFKQAEKDKGPIRVTGTIDGHPFTQTLVRYQQDWRLYINGPMLKAAGKQTGDRITLTLSFDPNEPVLSMHPKLKAALVSDKHASSIFESLIPSRKKEIIRYINNLKTDASVDLNVKRAIRFLSGKERFIGRDRP
jgi:hypothetical protein